MSGRTSVPRPPVVSAGAALLGLLVTLTVFAMMFLAFLLAPLLLFGAVLVAYPVIRPLLTPTSGNRPPVQRRSTTHRFGAGPS